MTGRWTWLLLNGHWAWCAAVVGVGLFSVLSGVSASRGLSTSKRAFLFALRLGALLLAAAAILRPAREIDLVRPHRTPLAIVVDTSRSMGLGPAAPGPVLQDWLRRSRGSLQSLSEFYRVETFGLGEPPTELSPAAAEGGGLFSGGQTPLGRTLESLARGRPELAGVVLLSDGRDTERPGRAPASFPFPIYPVLPDAGELPDLRIDAVETPPVAFIRTPLEVRVRLGLTGLPPGRATVTLLEEGKPVKAETVAVGSQGAVASLVFTPTRTGRRAYRVEVSVWPGDGAPQNNRAQFTLNVIRDKTRVLLVAGTPTWDVKYLRRRLSRDPGVDLITFMILRTPDDVSAVPQNELSLIPFPTPELFGKELPSFDAVIFANFDYGPYVPRQYLENVVKYVKEKGGGFAFLGGDRSFAVGGYEGTPVEEILPLSLPGASPGREYLNARFRPRLTGAGLTHPLFQWKGRTDENRMLWNSLPEMEGMNWVLRVKPEAVVLAENPEVRNEFGPLPVVALGEYGAGRTLAVATDSLWRWALPEVGKGGDESVYRDFWTRALRWLVHDPEMELVRLTLPPQAPRAGEAFRLRARVLDRSYGPATGAALAGSASGEDGRKVSLRWRETAAGEYAAEPVILNREGLWNVEVEARLSGAFLGRDSAGVAVEPESPEALRLGVDRGYLEALAAGSKGRAFPVKDGKLFELLEARGRIQTEVVGRRIEEPWAAVPLLVLSILLFGADWALRRVWE